MAKRYDTDKELRAEIQKRLRCEIPDEIWRANVPFDSPPYDNKNVKETILRLRESGIEPQTIKRPRSDILRSKLAVKSVDKEVRAIRETLFGSPDPPFEDFKTMREWILAEAKSQPPAEGHAPRYGYKFDWSKIPLEKALETYENLQKEKPGSYGMEYASLAVPQEDGWTGYVVVSDGTPIRRLWLAVCRIAKKLDCQEGQATGYVLMGRIPYLAALSGATPGTIDRVGGIRGKIVITIREPIPEEDLIKFYRKLRKSLWRKSRTPKPLNERDLLLAKFINEKMSSAIPSWDKYRREWNQDHPNYKFENKEGFRVAAQRANKKVFPEIDIRSILPGKKN